MGLAQPSLPPIAGPFGPSRRSSRVTSRAGIYAGVAVLALAVLAGGGLIYWRAMNRPGLLRLTVTPDDATVLIDNVKVPGSRSPFTIEKAPGPYMLSVTRDGYVRKDQNVELRAAEDRRLAVTLDASPDTGFEVTSEPAGGLVWLDGSPINGRNGQARTDFRALRIAVGHHVLEIKGENRFKPWREEIEVEAGAVNKVHAVLIPDTAVDSAAAQRPSPPAVAQTSRAERPEPARGGPARSHAADGPAALALGGGAAEGGGGKAARRKHARDLAAADGPSSSDTPAAAPEAPAEVPVKTATEVPAPAADGGDCSITLGSRPWSEVWIDGKNTNKHTPFADLKVPCGKHKLSFKRPDLQIDHNETITVKAGQKFRQSFALEAEPE
jgi:hypothetical protein